MITGSVNENLEAILALELRGEKDKSVDFEEIVDTGFNGFLTLPSASIEMLKLPWLFRQQGELADGSLAIFDVYEATINWDGHDRVIEAEAVDADPLVGMTLLAGHVLRVEVVEAGSVSVERLD